MPDLGLSVQVEGQVAAGAQESSVNGDEDVPPHRHVEAAKAHIAVPTAHASLRRRAAGHGIEDQQSLFHRDLHPRLAKGLNRARVERQRVDAQPGVRIVAARDQLGRDATYGV